jgi:hypothetical protein
MPRTTPKVPHLVVRPIRLWKGISATAVRRRLQEYLRASPEAILRAAIKDALR